MKKIFFFASILAGLVLTLLATIITNPASGTINVGENIGAQIDCLDYVACNMFWGDGSVTSGNDDDFYFNFRYHVYRNPGRFTINFRRYTGPDNYCPMNEYKTVIVRETRSITMSPEKPSAGQAIQFTAVGFKTPGDITWDMGDGKTYKHNKSSITHTYAKAGKYTVRAFDWKGDTTTTPVSLAITVSEPMRMITFTPAAPRVDQEVSLQALGFTSASIDWNFGDGTPQQTYSPAVAHRYQNQGTFIITAVEHGTNLAPATQAITILPENRSLSLSAQEARADEPITVTAVNFRGPQVLWDFGDGSTASGPGTVARAGRAGGISGPTTMTHAYRLPGSYTITARDENGASQKRFQTGIRIIGISDQVNLEIAEIALDNGKYYKVVPRNSKNIRAQLRMKMKGTGIVSGYWVVDGQPFQFFNETVFQGQIKTILTPEIPGLPVFDPGMHTITMQLTRPASEAVIFPVLRYFVLPYENEIAVLAPKDGAIIKEDEVATFAWDNALGGSHYQVAFASGIFPLMRNDESLTWHDCPERLRFTPDAETWKSIKRNEWTYWKVRALDSGRLIVAESGVMEMKIIVPGAKIGIERITDLDGNGIAIGGGLAATRAERVLVHGGLTYPAEAEYLILQVYANDVKVDQLLFRDVKRDEKRSFETSVPNAGPQCHVVFQVLKSSSPSMLVGYAELTLKKE